MNQDESTRQFPKSIVDAFAFSEAQRLIQSSGKDELSMTIFWREDSQEWECQFTNRWDHQFIATNFDIAKAIFAAAERMPDNFI